MSSEDQTPLVAEITEQLLDELLVRFPDLGDLEGRDGLAIVTAVGKAAWRGFLSGSAWCALEAQQSWANDLVPQIQGHLPPGVTLPERPFNLSLVDEEMPDPWADRYGGEDDD
jgi:hypothetical protein